MKKIIFLISLILILFLPFIVLARSGCCSWHGGVCGCKCCDGTPLSSTCAPYYPGCSSPYKSPSYNTPSYKSTPTCPLNSSYSSLYDTCECNYGYIASNNACVNANSYCTNLYGYHSSYDTLYNNCKCDYGYILGKGGILYDYECISEDKYCENIYGSHSKSNNNGSCICDSGYQIIEDECIKGNFVYINKIIDNEDKAIITDSKSDSYLIEYGVGCLSIWKYENSSYKSAFIEIGGYSIDGISDKLYLLDDNANCIIWDAEEIDLDDYSKKTTIKTCPINSTLDILDNKCYCNDDYKINSDGSGCIKDIICPDIINGYLGLDNKCYCNDGYIMRNNICITSTESCKKVYGNNVYGIKKDETTSNCYCNDGYEWNDLKTNCIIINSKEVSNFKEVNFIEKEKSYITSVDKNLTDRLKGKILLQIEEEGAGWYINPDNQKRYYLGLPTDAFNVMRELGLGVSNENFDSWGEYAPKNLSGKILLKVEDKGQAYYVNPDDLKMHYLGLPSDAFQVMRELGLGITNDNIRKIDIN